MERERTTCEVPTHFTGTFKGKIVGQFRSITDPFQMPEFRFVIDVIPPQLR